jgi:hypothetical protein
MSLYRYKGSKVWTRDFIFHGQRIRESTGTVSGHNGPHECSLRALWS